MPLTWMLGASAAAADDTDAEPSTSTALAGASGHVAAPRFKNEFQPFAGPRPDLKIPATAVDLDAFDPPVEDANTRNLGTGIASYYGRRFHGRHTASGERFDMNAMTAAHKTLPFGSRVKVTNANNGRSVIVRINDRGPFVSGRTIDLSRAAAKQIGLIGRGHAKVELAAIE